MFELAFRWLADHYPAPGEMKLVHGDFRNGNLMIGPEGVRAVLDWEIAHVGDPMEDLGWICTTPWRFGVLDKPVGGFGEREDLWTGYEAAFPAITALVDATLDAATKRGLLGEPGGLDALGGYVRRDDRRLPRTRPFG